MFKVLKVLRAFKGRSKAALALAAVLALAGVTNPALLAGVATVVDAVQALAGG